MLRIRPMAMAASLVFSALPLSDLYAICLHVPTIGGEWMFCDNGRCWSRSFWTNDGQLLPGSTDSACRNEA
jgi:hypothetical protein